MAKNQKVDKPHKRTCYCNQNVMKGQLSKFARLGAQMQLPEMDNMASLHIYTTHTCKYNHAAENSNCVPAVRGTSIKQMEQMKLYGIPISALYPLKARLPMHAMPKPEIHSLVDSPKRNAVDLTPTFTSSSLSCLPIYGIRNSITWLQLQDSIKGPQAVLLYSP